MMSWKKTSEKITESGLANKDTKRVQTHSFPPTVSKKKQKAISIDTALKQKQTDKK
jgi:hypothetical protein